MLKEHIAFLFPETDFQNFQTADLIFQMHNLTFELSFKL